MSSLIENSIYIGRKKYFIIEITGEGVSSVVFTISDQNKNKSIVKIFGVNFYNIHLLNSLKFKKIKEESIVFYTRHGSFISTETKILKYLNSFNSPYLPYYYGQFYNDYYGFNLIHMEYIDHKENLKMNDFKSVAYQLFDALYFIHSHGIVHRDIKPDNIIISSNLKVKLIDFGAACFINQDCEIEIVGTTEYMAPEVEEENLSDIYDWYKVDVYSASKTLEHLFGHHTQLKYGLENNSDRRYDAFHMRNLFR